MYNPFTRTEENAIMRYVFAIIDADVNIDQSEEAFLTLLGMKFGFSQRDLMNAVITDEQVAVRTLSSMSAEKKRLATSLFTAAALADGNTRLGKAEMEKCLNILKKCSLPMDVPFTESVRIAHSFVDR